MLCFVVAMLEINLLCHVVAMLVDAMMLVGFMSSVDIMPCLVSDMR